MTVTMHTREAMGLRNLAVDPGPLSKTVSAGTRTHIFQHQDSGSFHYSDIFDEGMAKHTLQPAPSN